LSNLEGKLGEIIEEQRRAEEEQASRGLLRTIQRAFREALLALPAEEYDWFDIQARSMRAMPGFSEGQSTPIASNGNEAPPSILHTSVVLPFVCRLKDARAGKSKQNVIGISNTEKPANAKR
jgi:hypothetical protein